MNTFIRQNDRETDRKRKQKKHTETIKQKKQPKS